MDIPKELSDYMTKNEERHIIRIQQCIIDGIKETQQKVKTSIIVTIVSAFVLLLAVLFIGVINILVVNNVMNIILKLVQVGG